MSTWIVRDWAGNTAYNGKEFDNYGQARAYIDEKASELYKTEQEQDGYCEDMYAINIDEDGNEIPDNGQYYY